MENSKLFSSKLRNKKGSKLEVLTKSKFFCVKSKILNVRQECQIFEKDYALINGEMDKYNKFKEKLEKSLKVNQQILKEKY